MVAGLNFGIFLRWALFLGRFKFNDNSTYRVLHLPKICPKSHHLSSTRISPSYVCLENF
ncbi:hypothetical protein ACS0TY_007064 [Phlomoides rotata]